MRGKWKSSYYKRYAQFMREVRQGEHGTKPSRKRKSITLKEAKSNYQNYWKKYNRTAAIAIGGFCTFCRTAPCSCEELYGKHLVPNRREQGSNQTQKANADTGYDAPPSTSHPSNRTHLVKRAPRLTPREGLGRN